MQTILMATLLQVAGVQTGILLQGRSLVRETCPTELCAAGVIVTMAAVPSQSQRNHPMAQDLRAQGQGSHLLGWCWEPSTTVSWGPWEQGLHGCLPVPEAGMPGEQPPSTSKGEYPQNKVAETAGTVLVAH